MKKIGFLLGSLAGAVFVKEVVRLFKLLLSSFQVTPSELCSG
jgi:hypothetical protein